jgi:geranylgeranyl diphosphate synthase type II
VLKELTDWLRRDEFDRDKKVKAITEIYNNLNIRKLTESRIKQLFSEALLSLDKVSVRKERKRVLEEFASQLLIREK